MTNPLIHNIVVQSVAGVASSFAKVALPYLGEEASLVENKIERMDAYIQDGISYDPNTSVSTKQIKVDRFDLKLAQTPQKALNIKVFGEDEAASTPSYMILAVGMTKMLGLDEQLFDREALSVEEVKYKGSLNVEVGGVQQTLPGMVLNLSNGEKMIVLYPRGTREVDIIRRVNSPKHVLHRSLDGSYAVLKKAIHEPNKSEQVLAHKDGGYGIVLSKSSGEPMEYKVVPLLSLPEKGAEPAEVHFYKSQGDHGFGKTYRFQPGGKGASKYSINIYAYQYHLSGSFHPGWLEGRPVGSGDNFAVQEYRHPKTGEPFYQITINETGKSYWLVWLQYEEPASSGSNEVSKVRTPVLMDQLPASARKGKLAKQGVYSVGDISEFKSNHSIKFTHAPGGTQITAKPASQPKPKTQKSPLQTALEEAGFDEIEIGRILKEANGVKKLELIIRLGDGKRDAVVDNARAILRHVEREQRIGIPDPFALSYVDDLLTEREDRLRVRLQTGNIVGEVSSVPEEPSHRPGSLAGESDGFNRRWSDNRTDRRRR